MCGFVAMYSKDNQPVSLEQLQKMNRMITHRGPDDEGYVRKGPIGLGFRRLSIIDLQHGHQPLTNEDESIWLIFNGEIYNYRELQTWLKERGHQFRTDTDSETILHLYEEYGTETPKYLRGMFSFIIWDGKEQRFFGARDHFGIKPLYWVETPHAFGFGSEIKSLLEMERVKAAVDPVSFYHYLTFQYVPDPATMFAGIHKLLPGHSFTIKNGTMNIESYFQVEFTPEERPFEEYVEETRAVLKESVERHMMSDVPRGAFLSSGVDSSSIAALLRKQEKLKTFTIGFDIPGYSELDYARRTAAHIGTDHHEVEVDGERYLDVLPRLIWHQDEPVADPSAIALYFVAELASQYVTVVLSGEGADEFFGGYNIYREPFALAGYQRLPQGMRTLFANMASNLPEGTKGRSFLIRGSQQLEERFFGNAHIYSEEMKEQVIAASLKAKVPYVDPWQVTAPIYEQVQHYDDVTKMQYLDIHTWLRGNILMKADKMTMANSLELRVPFIDTEVFKVAMKIPTKYKIADGTTKHVLREAMKDLLPPEIKTKKKLGFPVPTRYWLRHDFYKWAKDLIQQSPTQQYFNKQYLLQMLEQHKDEKHDYSRPIWTALVFMLWHQIYIEKKYSFGPYVSPHVAKRHKLYNL